MNSKQWVDKTLQGGIRKGEIIVICAGNGTGKSKYRINKDSGGVTGFDTGIEVSSACSEGSHSLKSKATSE